MWKSIATNESTWVRFKAHLQEAYLDREEIEQTTGAVGYDSAKNVKHSEIADAFMNFAPATAAHDAAFTELTTTNRNMSRKSRQQEDQIRALQVELCNLKIAAET